MSTGVLARDVDSLLEQAAEVRRKVHLARRTHYEMADSRARIHRVVGGLTVVTSAFVSAGLLTSVDSNPGFELTLAAGIVALVAAMLAGLQTFYRFGELAEKHRLAAANYGDVRAELDLLIARHGASAGGDFDAALRDLRRQVDRVARFEQAGPGYPGKVYRKVEKQVAAEEKVARRTSAS
jgi:hypothetical protein